MTAELHYGPLGDEHDHRELAEILSLAFGAPSDETAAWVNDRIGPSNMRVIADGARPVACLAILPDAHYFGGRPVTAGCIAGVTVAPHARASGLSTRLMHGALRDMDRAGLAISSLYPSTLPVYRRAGYEPAGSRFEVRVPLARIDVRADEPPIRPATDADRDAIATCYHAHAARTDGYLHRSDYIWDRVYKPHGERPRAFVVEQDGAIEGYVFMLQRKLERARYDLLLELSALTPAAARRILGFLFAQRSLGADAIFYGGANASLLALLPDRPYSMRLLDHWMLRIVSVPRALAARGYPAGLEREIAIAVRDDMLPENDGTFVVAVSNGQGEVRRASGTSSARVTLGVRGLAALYTGHMSPLALRAVGLVDGDDTSLAELATLFAGPAPAMADSF